MKNNVVVSLFSGGGGLDAGFVNAGFDIRWAVDNEKNAVATYRANIGPHIQLADINEIELSGIPYCDVVIGGPPCQSFSLAGKRETEDIRGRLVWRYIDIIKHLQPKAFLFENVTGLLSAKNHDGERILPLLEKAFERIGYTISINVMNASEYGIPQRRKRLIIVGLLERDCFVFPQPTHGLRASGNTPIVTVSDAIDDLPPAVKDENGGIEYTNPSVTAYQKLMRKGSAMVTEHSIPRMSEMDKLIISHVKPGGNYRDIPSDIPSKRIRRLQRDGGHTTCYGRLLPNMPSYTINTYFNRPNVGCNIHHSENRLITVREALRLQSFPDKYRIISSSKQGYHTIVGNAVPPMLAGILAAALREQL
jgi:DNA (cytosine-5)-methyltransferase 1